MTYNNTLFLNKISLELKVLATCFLVSLLIGYAVSLIKIYNISHFNLLEAALFYRGDETGQDLLRLPQSYGSLLSVAHVHSLALPLMFTVLGFIFCYCQADQKLKTFVILLAFIGILVSNVSPCLVRTFSPRFIILLPLSQIAIAISLLMMTSRSFYDLWIR